MSDWQEASLADLAEYINGRAIKPEECSTQQGIPVIRIKQINDPQSIEDRFCGDDLEEKNIARSGDLLFSWSATLKTILWQGPTGAINQHIFKVLPKEGIDKTFLHYLIDHSIPALTEESHGSTMKHIKKSALSAFHLQIPPLPEQKKIAEILSGIDKRREATTKKAANILRLQNALREKIFSSLHGERVPLGEICNPKQWQTISTTQLTDSGYPVYGANGMIGYFSEFNHKDPVLAVTCRGATCGNLTLVPGFSYVTGNSMCLDNPRSDTSPEYLFHFLSWRGLKDVISGSAQPQITRSPLQAVEVVLPSVEKQDKIVSALESVSNMEHSIKTMLDRLDLLKQALATDLLSGRKRVSV